MNNIKRIYNRGIESLEAWYAVYGETSKNTKRKGRCQYCGTKISDRRSKKVAESETIISSVACNYKHEQKLQERYEIRKYDMTGKYAICAK